MKPSDEELQAKIEQSRISMEDHWRKRWVKVMEGELSLKEKESSKPTPIWTTAPGLAVLGAVITLLTGVITNYWQNQSALADRRQELQSELIQKAIERAPNHQDAALNLNFLWKAGLIPDYDKIPEFVEKSGLLSDDPAELPSMQTFGAHSDAVMTESMPEYELSVPKVASSKTAQRVLEIAVAEINQDIHERISPEAVRKYWKGLGIAEESLQNDPPWSAAFLSWVLSEAGNPGGLKKSATGLDIWNSAVKKGLTFQLSEQLPRPGDLVFFSRDGNATDEIRKGNVPQAPSNPGIVYEVSDKEMKVISGNVSNAIRLSTRPLSGLKSDVTLIGFVRLPGE